METGTDPGSSRSPKTLRIHRQQVVDPRWRMAKETRVAGGEGGGATEAQVRGKRAHWAGEGGGAKPLIGDGKYC